MIGASQSLGPHESMRRIGSKVIRRLSRIIRRTWILIVARPYDPIDLFAMLVCIIGCNHYHRRFTSLWVLCTSIDDIVSIENQHIIISFIHITSGISIFTSIANIEGGPSIYGAFAVGQNGQYINLRGVLRKRIKTRN